MIDPDNPHRPDGRRIDITVRTSATPEQVWAAWTDPATLSQWFTDDARGEARPGGTLTWIFRDFGLEIPYPVLVAEPHRRLVLAGELPGRGPFALEVRIGLEGGHTVVRLVNSGFLDGTEWDDEFAGVHSGWQNALAILGEYLEHHYQVPKRNVLVLRPGHYEPAALYPWFREAGCLRQWLTQEGEIGDADTPVQLTLADGALLRGRVLAATGREVSVSWQEVRGVLELKAFGSGVGSPPGRMLGARVTAWGLPDRTAEELKRFLAGAVDRLAARFPAASRA